MGVARGGSAGRGRRPAWIARVAKRSAIGAPFALVAGQAINRGLGAGQDAGPEAVALGGAADAADHPDRAVAGDQPGAPARHLDGRELLVAVAAGPAEPVQPHRPL